MNRTPNPTKELLIVVIHDGDKILMRKKPQGSAPYRETWYLFGVERNTEQDEEDTISNYLHRVVGVRVDGISAIGKDEERKKDHDGVVKNFVYRDFICRYVSGEPLAPSDNEQVAWIEKSKLDTLDLVPPSVRLFKKMGYLLS